MQSFERPPSFASLFGKSKTTEPKTPVELNHSLEGRKEQRLQTVGSTLDPLNERFSPQSDLARTLLDIQAAGIELPRNTKLWVENYYQDPEASLESDLSREIQNFIESLEDP